jgi:hypothetical protein
MIENLAQARNAGVKTTARCAFGRREAMKSIRESKLSVRLDLERLIWTRGESFPVSMLAERLKCPPVRVAEGCAAFRFAGRADRQAGAIAI